jgi:hypothetical protein
VLLLLLGRCRGGVVGGGRILLGGGWRRVLLGGGGWRRVLLGGSWRRVLLGGGVLGGIGVPTTTAASRRCRQGDRRGQGQVGGRGGQGLGLGRLLVHAHGGLLGGNNGTRVGVRHGTR